MGQENYSTFKGIFETPETYTITHLKEAFLFLAYEKWLYKFLHPIKIFTYFQFTERALLGVRED